MSEAMTMLKKPLAVLLGLTAAAVLGHFLFGPFYENVLGSGDVWSWLNIFMAFSLLVASAAAFAGKRASGGSDAKTYLGLNAVVTFYVTAALTIAFLWNWLGQLHGGNGDDGTLSGFYWVAIDVIFPLLIGGFSIQLWKDA